MNREIKNVAILGTGLIGASWAAFYAEKGFSVKQIEDVFIKQGFSRKIIKDVFKNI